MTRTEELNARIFAISDHIARLDGDLTACDRELVSVLASLKNELTDLSEREAAKELYRAVATINGNSARHLGGYLADLVDADIDDAEEMGSAMKASLANAASRGPYAIVVANDVFTALTGKTLLTAASDLDPQFDVSLCE